MLAVGTGGVRYHNPTRERGTDLHRFRDVCDQSLAHASGWDTSGNYGVGSMLGFAEPGMKGAIRVA